MVFAALKAIFYTPLYNGLIFLIGVIPGASAGAAVILFTILVKLLLFPLSFRASQFQYEMKLHEPELNRLKERHKGNREAQSRAILEFYRQHGINPFAGILPLFIQIPIVIALYYVFYRGGLPSVDSGLLYSFVSAPAVTMSFFGVNIGGKSALLAVLSGIAQFLQAHFAAPATGAAPPKTSFQSDLARSMQLQMKYVFPVLMAFVAYQTSGAVALYLITSNLFSVGQELYVRRAFRQKGLLPAVVHDQSGH